MANASAELGTRVPRKAKMLLDRLVGSRTMTPEGMEWLICATDPFHDDRVRCPGYPDLSTVNSVVQTYTTTASFNAPAGAVNPWDLHIPFIPFSSPPTAVPGTISVLSPYNMSMTGELLSPGNQIFLYPGFNGIVVGTSGASWVSSPASATLTNNSVLAIPPKFSSGFSRLVACGVELVNTTAQLYKGGSLTVYRAPSTVEKGTVKTPVLIAAQNYFMPTPVDGISLPPGTQTFASTYTDSRTWSAEDGAYVIVSQTDVENPFRSLKPTDVMANTNLDYTTWYANFSGGISTTAWCSVLSGPSTTGGNTGRGTHALPFENCGAILAGLNPNSTIQATVRYYFERIPALTEPDLLAMAQVPPAFDGVALEIYSRCLSSMPVGVPQNENPLGEWFTGILDTIAGVAPKIGSFVSNLGNAIGMVGGNQPQPSSSNATAQRNMNNQQKKQQQASLPKRIMPPLPPLPKNAAKRAKRKRKAKTGKQS
jgi:hypothetical protein